MYTRQVENLKRRLGQKRVSRWIENLKGQSRQKLGIKAYDYVSFGSLMKLQPVVLLTQAQTDKAQSNRFRLNSKKMRYLSGNSRIETQ